MPNNTRIMLKVSGNGYYEMMNPNYKILVQTIVNRRSEERYDSKWLLPSEKEFQIDVQIDGIINELRMQNNTVRLRCTM